jgi:hypothetical protein
LHSAITYSGTPGSGDSGSGSIEMCALSIWVVVSALHGAWPESSRYSRTPSAYTSEAGSTASVGEPFRRHVRRCADDRCRVRRSAPMRGGDAEVDRP